MSDLFKWFEKRREMKVLKLMQRHLAMTMSIVEDLERAIRAAVKGDEKETGLCVGRVASGERDADRLRREVMSELARGELPPVDREDLMRLMKSVDMVADWSRESTRVLNATLMREAPENIRSACVEMVKGVKECAFALRKCVSQLTENPEEALRAADRVERLEEKVDDLYENARMLQAEDTTMRVGVAVLTSELLQAIEMVADWCENSCDQVRIISVRYQG